MEAKEHENSKEDEESVNAGNTNLSDLTEIKHDNHDFICPICLRFIVAATTTHCGHTFCEICISEYLLFYSVFNNNIYLYCFFEKHMIFIKKKFNFFF